MVNVVWSALVHEAPATVIRFDGQNWSGNKLRFQSL